ncbi:MAG: DUF378 domain-containing protein [Verrucomicrobia bacterium]|nr:DUF378 domain-containing protein [Verrucomicrobiota bacterium]
MIPLWYGKSESDRCKKCLACESDQCRGRSLNPIIRFFILLLVVVGAVNWGLWGLFQFDIVAWIFNGNTAIASRIVYVLVGLAGIMSLLAFGCTNRAISKK